MPASAQLKDLTINADRLAVEKEKQQIEAEGSVEVYYKNITLFGQHLTYNTSAETFQADRGFSLLYQDLTFEGQSLNYDIKGQSGTAENTHFHYQGVEIGGSQLSFNPDQLRLKNAHFSTCDLDSPHYRVSASDLTVDTKYGWMVAYWGLFWLGQVPVVPVPTYIYDFKAAEKAQQNIPPFPNIGSDPVDGNYITETLAWHLKRELSGTYSLSYFANKGLGLGTVANYILNEENNGNLRLNWNAKDTFFGGLTHSFAFGQTMLADNISPLVLVGPRSHQYRLALTLSSREWLNYQRVSFLPNLVLSANRFSLANNQLNADIELTAGRIEELATLHANRAGGKFRLYKLFPETPAGSITPYLVYDGFLYSNGSQWIKPSLGLAAIKNIAGPLSVGLHYNHYLFIYGASPFLYENYQYRPVDTLQGSIKFLIGETLARLGASYYLDNWSPQDIDYTLFFRLHCYNLEATYRSIRKEFALGFSLASQ